MMEEVRKDGRARWLDRPVAEDPDPLLARMLEVSEKYDVGVSILGFRMLHDTSLAARLTRGRRLTERTRRKAEKRLDEYVEEKKAIARQWLSDEPII